MRTWLANLWLTVSSGIWFVPGLMMLGGVVLAMVGPAIDRQTGPVLPDTMRVTAETARSTLSALVGAMITVTGIVFSTTTVAVSITSTQLGPRLLRNFLGQLVTQVTLGVCLATSVYCLILLRRIDKLDGDVFVPNLSLLMANLMGLVTLMVIVYFIHRVVHSMQAQNVASDVADELDGAIQRLFPERIGEPTDDVAGEEAWRDEWDRFEGAEVLTVEAESDGYLQAVDDDTPLSVAERLGAVLRLRARPGDFIRSGQPLVDILGGDEPDDSDRRMLRRSFLMGNLRTTQQDVECAIDELVEIAVRALSPGVNDPFTAVTCVDRLSGALRRLAQRRMPSGLRTDDEGAVRLVARPRTFPTVVNAAFNQIRQHSREDVAVTSRILEAIAAIAPAATRAPDRESLRRQADMTIAAARVVNHTDEDLADIESRYELACDALDGRAA